MDEKEKQLAMQDVEFNKFVDQVSPKNGEGKQPVWFTEVAMILKLLWEIYNLAKDMGCMKKTMMLARTKRAMSQKTLSLQEEELKTVLAKLQK